MTREMTYNWTVPCAGYDVLGTRVNVRLGQHMALRRREDIYGIRVCECEIERSRTLDWPWELSIKLKIEPVIVTQASASMALAQIPGPPEYGERHYIYLYQHSKYTLQML